MPSGSACRCTSTPTSSRARSTSASRSTASVRSSFSGVRAAWAHEPPSSMRPTPTTASSTFWPRRVRASASARRPRGTSATAFAPLERLRERGIGICIGSDSNVRIDPLEELRELETSARRQALSREVFDCRDASLLRRRRRRGGSRPRVVAGHRRRPGAPVAARHRARRRPGRARLRLFRRGLRRGLADARGQFPPGSSAWSPGRTPHPWASAGTGTRPGRAGSWPASVPSIRARVGRTSRRGRPCQP